MPRSQGPIEPTRPRAGKVEDVAAHYGMSRSFFYAENKAGRIKFLKIDGSTVVEYSEADRWFEDRAKPIAA